MASNVASLPIDPLWYTEDKTKGLSQLELVRVKRLRLRRVSVGKMTVFPSMGKTGTLVGAL